jgi:hypothetical protein
MGRIVTDLKHEDGKEEKQETRRDTTPAERTTRREASGA